MLPSNYNYIDTLIERYEADVEDSTALIKSIEGVNKHIKDIVFESRYKYHKDLKDVLITLKSSYWREVYSRSNLADVVSSKAREEIEKSFYEEKDTLPDFTVENIKSTLQAWATDSYRMFGEKIDTVFQRLSGEHVTNRPSGFSKKMIYKYMINYTYSWASTFDQYTFNDYAVGLIHDLRTSIQMLYNLPISARHDTYTVLKAISNRNEYTDFDNGAFKIKVFKNGNAHVELHPHVAVMLNCELAKIYPSAIPSKHRTITKEIPDYTFEYDHLSNREIDALKEFIASSARYVENGKHVYKINRRYFAGEFIKGIFDFLQVETVVENEKYLSNFELVEPFRHMITNGVVEFKSNQYYPTPDLIVDDLVDYVGDVTGLSVLEPSSGMGNIAKRFDNCLCIEKEPLNCVILREMKMNVLHGDFLRYDKEKFDVIVMNPPYNNKQWKTHTEHAVNILKDGGVVWAVLPVGKLNDLSEFGQAELIKTYTNEFEKTSISTAIYRIEKKEK